MWEPHTPGLFALPSGKKVRGRSLTSDIPPHDEAITLQLSWSEPEADARVVWIQWADFGAPKDKEIAASTLRAMYSTLDVRRVEVASSSGIGRTGTVLASFAVLDGLSPREAINYARSYYHRRAVETPWQRRFVASFA